MKRLYLWLWCAVWWGQAAGGSAQFALPVDFAQGVVLDERAPRRPYFAELVIAPSFEVGRLRLSAVAAPAFVNPDWDLGLGGRASYALFVAPREVAVLRVEAGGHYLPLTAESARIGGAIVVEGLRTLRIGVLIGHDFGVERVHLGAILGFDAIALARVLSGGGEVEAADRESRRTLAAETHDLDRLRDGVRSRALGILPHERKRDALCWAREREATLASAPDAEAVARAAVAAGFPELGAAVREALPVVRDRASAPAARTDAEVRAVVGGLLGAAEEVEAVGRLDCSSGHLTDPQLRVSGFRSRRF